jgi:hypothetical protein
VWSSSERTQLMSPRSLRPVSSADWASLSAISTTGFGTPIFTPVFIVIVVHRHRPSGGPLIVSRMNRCDLRGDQAFPAGRVFTPRADKYLWPIHHFSPWQVNPVIQ